jgi:hypothetical protein
VFEVKILNRDLYRLNVICLNIVSKWLTYLFQLENHQFVKDWHMTWRDNTVQ